MYNSIYTEKYGIVHFKWVNWMVYQSISIKELFLNSEYITCPSQKNSNLMKESIIKSKISLPTHHPTSGSSLREEHFLKVSGFFVLLVALVLRLNNIVILFLKSIFYSDILLWKRRKLTNTIYCLQNPHLSASHFFVISIFVIVFTFITLKKYIHVYSITFQF